MKSLYYFNPKDTQALRDYTKTLSCLIRQKAKGREIVLLCIGSDRATGDCLGPMVGHQLLSYKKNSRPRYRRQPLSIYGTIEHPVHARNLKDTIDSIYAIHHNPLIIAIDASLGTAKHLGYITLGEGSLNPGIGVDKALPVVGDIFITGIVNRSGMVNQMLLQTTRLHTVLSLSHFISLGLQGALN